MSRFSYLQRIARTDRNVPTLRPPAAIFRRWEMTQIATPRQQPASLDQSPVATEATRKLSPTPVASPAPRTLAAATNHIPRKQPETTQPDSDRPTETDTSPALKTAERDSPIQAEVPAANNLARQQQRAKPEATREPITASRQTNSIAPAQRWSNVSADLKASLNPSDHRERAAPGQTRDLPARGDLNSSIDRIDATAATDAPGPRKPAETPRLLQTHYRPLERRESKPAPSMARKAAAEPTQPTVKIGTIDVQITPPPAAMPQSNTARSAGRKPAAALSKSFTSSFGLRQG